LVEAMHHRRNFTVVSCTGHHKRSRCWIETWIIGLNCSWKVSVILF
jgi:hypothetical protein